MRCQLSLSFFVLSFGCLVAFSAECPAAERVVFDFEADQFDGWTVEGAAFADGPVPGQSLDVSGYRGRSLVNSFHGSDSETGTLTSPEFVITHDWLSFLISGGKSDGLRAELLVGRKVIEAATGEDSAALRWVSWDVRKLRSEKARLRIVDQAKGLWGHINVDQVVIGTSKRSGPGVGTIPVRGRAVVVEDFDGGSYAGWKATGEAFGKKPAEGQLGGQMTVGGFSGRGLVNSFLDGDATTGTLTSPEFTLTHPFVSFLIGGGNLPGEVGMELLIDDKRVRIATGSESEMLAWHSWDLREFRGQIARLRIFDRATGGWGHVLIDQILLTEQRQSIPKVGRLSSYRKSRLYYREPFRPQFHFTPEINWINDPNGLVYFDGEYHLFFQHNPHGNKWGHMSWGHAVSRDLLHWKHLPIALQDQYGVMIFSGCAVFDQKNTSGLGTKDSPPLVAIYTGHGHGRQTQDLAFSNDRGRTWTKFEGNPVLDIGEKDFRDPKVFRLRETNHWVMVVSLAAKKRIQFYGSPDLKQWKKLSEFGPAGVSDKPNWECPDLFRLPIENEPGKHRWVLEADMGNGSVAGGSGGEYFVGEFDGTHFVADSKDSRWVDYGRDFYAPVSWSDIPKQDGRRIWIGWMNNWSSAETPTYPWRGGMSVPREVSLASFGLCSGPFAR